MVQVAPNGSIPAGAAQYLSTRYSSYAFDTRLSPDGDVLYAGERDDPVPYGLSSLCLKISSDFSTVRWQFWLLDTTPFAGAVDTDEQNNAYCVTQRMGWGIVEKITPDGTNIDQTVVGRSWGNRFPSTDGSTQSGPSDGYLYEAGNFQ
jgi:hypothetical protein